MSWWDGGRYIEDSTNRKVIIKTPSRETLRFTLKSEEWYETNVGKLSPNNKVKDVAIALINPELTAEIMDRYNSKFLFITKQDTMLYPTLNAIAINGDPSNGSFEFCCAEYLDKSKCPKDVLNSALFRAVNGKDIEGLTKIYEDSFVVIYELEQQIT